MEDFVAVRSDKFSNEEKDCSLRAIVALTYCTYDEVHDAFEEAGRKRGRGSTRRHIMKACEILGITLTQVKVGGTIASLIKRFPGANFYINKSTHGLAIIDGKIFDNTSPKSHIKMAWSLS